MIKVKDNYISYNYSCQKNDYSTKKSYFSRSNTTSVIHLDPTDHSPKTGPETMITIPLKTNWEWERIRTRDSFLQKSPFQLVSQGICGGGIIPRGKAPLVSKKMIITNSISHSIIITTLSCNNRFKHIF